MHIVHKNKLIFLSGILWSGIGVLLNFFASRYFHLFSSDEKMYVIIGGVILGLLIAYFGFKNLAQKNIDRIQLYPDRVSIFKFQRKSMYILIIFMISLGIFMRKTTFVPRNLLAAIYIGIGFALFAASFKYHLILLKKTDNS